MIHTILKDHYALSTFWIGDIAKGDQPQLYKQILRVIVPSLFITQLFISCLKDLNKLYSRIHLRSSDLTNTKYLLPQASGGKDISLESIRWILK